MSTTEQTVRDTTGPYPAQGPAALLGDFSLEMTGKDLDELYAARDLIPTGARINVTYLYNENLEMRVAASSGVKHSGFLPVPHVSARRLSSPTELQNFLGALRDEHATESLFVIGGDPAEPMGPYSDALSVIRSGELQNYGAQRISIAGYPEGHPDIATGLLWSALKDKARALDELGMQGDILTQFAFDVDTVLDWVEEVRGHGVDMPIRIGVPGPAGVKRLIAYAKRFGVGLGAGIAKKYGLSLTNLMSTAGPDRFITELSESYDPGRHGQLRLHFYTFGGIQATSQWIADYAAKH